MARGEDSLDGSRPRALVVSKRGRFYVGEPLFDRGSAAQPLPRPRPGRIPGGIALCRVDRRGAQPIVDLGRADNARDVVGALVADRGLRPTFRDRHEEEARRAIERLAARPGRPPRPDRRADLHRRPGQRPRLRRRRLRQAPRAAASASGSTSPTSPPTSSPRAASTARRSPAPTPPTRPGIVSPMLPAVAERRRLQPRARRRAARGHRRDRAGGRPARRGRRASTAR